MDLNTRVVIPLSITKKIQIFAPRLNPLITINNKDLFLAPQLITAVATRTLGKKITNIDHQRELIVAAIDFLIIGF